MKNILALPDTDIKRSGGILSIKRRWRVPAMIGIAIILTAALWTALIRLGWDLPSVAGATAVQHGALMVSGFLGTLISLERAVALKRKWTYIAPAASAIGALLILAGLPALLGHSLIVVASFGLAAIFATIYRRHSSMDTAVMAIGSILWLAGNVLWWANLPIAQAVPWWAGFLVLTIAGERLELARVLRLTPLTKRLFAGSIVVFLAGLALSLFFFDAGVRVAGAGLFLLAVWLIRYDIARHTIRKSGLTRFIAACLLPGYVWMAGAGIVWIVYAPYFLGGLYYDAMLHMIFLGFVFSMIFGHAPIILPSVLGVPVVYRPAFYFHLILLHASLAVRVIGDLLLDPALRQWGGLLNVCAVLLFIGVTAWSTRSVRNPRKPDAATAGQGL
ncbi:MAG: hypothetical protein M1434_00655 [Chloroflexi bacterium]|nr:hypothetical protein [Chloroflexota bacterium]MCL5273243.1 hypothetical protein [Chloroflexota bacterium]